ncbi:unnamed protein product [Ascophyllum nodosum]
MAPEPPAAPTPTPLPSETFRYQGRLLAMQQRKRHANHDVLMLQNRISLLRKEEEKAWKKIQLAKLRSEEIMRMREENEKRVLERISAAEKQAYYTITADECKLQKERNYAVEEMARQKRARMLQEFMISRRDDVAQIRQEKQRLRENLISMRQDIFRENREKRSDIKHQEDEARNARLEGKARAVEESRRSYENRVKREEDEIAAREQKVARMEQRELALIQQLKNTQAMQRRAYAELEAALSDSRALATRPFVSQHPGGRPRVTSRP